MQAALTDTRVIYRHFRAQDAMDERRRDSKLVCMRQLWWEGSPVSWEKPLHFNLEHWSLGLKRRLARHLSRGSLIGDFDDDDLYCLDHMYHALLRGVEEKKDRIAPEEARQGKFIAIVTLSEWHMLYVWDLQFRWMDPKGDHMLDDWRDPIFFLLWF